VVTISSFPTFFGTVDDFRKSPPALHQTWTDSDSVPTSSIEMIFFSELHPVCALTSNNVVNSYNFAAMFQNDCRKYIPGARERFPRAQFPYMNNPLPWLSFKPFNDFFIFREEFHFFCLEGGESTPGLFQVFSRSEGF
jgi:hypothetical protein